MHSSVRRKIHSKTASTACLFYGTFSFCTCYWLGRGSSSLSYLRKENNGAVDYIKRSNTKQFRGLAVNILVLFPVLRIRSIHLHNDWKYTCTTFAHEPILSTHLATIRFQFRELEIEEVQRTNLPFRHFRKSVVQEVELRRRTKMKCEPRYKKCVTGDLATRMAREGKSILESISAKFCFLYCILFLWKQK